MKKILSILVVAFLGFISNLAFAEVRFELVYTDERNMGFHVRPEAQKMMKDCIGSFF